MTELGMSLPLGRAILIVVWDVCGDGEQKRIKKKKSQQTKSKLGLAASICT
jgi:hypothetical protein